MTGNHLASDPFLDRAAPLATGGDLSRAQMEGPVSQDEDSADIDSEGFTAGPSSAPARTRVLDDVFRDPNLSRLVLAVLRARGIPEEDREELRLDVLMSLYVWCRKESSREGAEDVELAARALTRKCARIYARGVAGVAKRDAASFHVDAIEVKAIVAELGDLLATGNLSVRAAATLVALTEDGTYLLAGETDGSAAAPTSVSAVAPLGAKAPRMLLAAGLALAVVVVLRAYFGMVPFAP